MPKDTKVFRKQTRSLMDLNLREARRAYQVINIATGGSHIIATPGIAQGKQRKRMVNHLVPKYYLDALKEMLKTTDLSENPHKEFKEVSIKTFTTEYMGIALSDEILKCIGNLDNILSKQLYFAANPIALRLIPEIRAFRAKMDNACLDFFENNIEKIKALLLSEKDTPLKSAILNYIRRYEGDNTLTPKNAVKALSNFDRQELIFLSEDAAIRTVMTEIFPVFNLAGIIQNGINDFYNHYTRTHILSDADNEVLRTSEHFSELPSHLQTFIKAYTAHAIMHHSSVQTLARYTQRNIRLNANTAALIPKHSAVFFDVKRMAGEADCVFQFKLDVKHINASTEELEIAQAEAEVLRTKKPKFLVIPSKPNIRYQLLYPASNNEIETINGTISLVDEKGIPTDGEISSKSLPRSIQEDIEEKHHVMRRLLAHNLLSPYHKPGKDSAIAFGIGRRACPGAHIAQSMIEEIYFLYLKQQAKSPRTTYAGTMSWFLDGRPFSPHDRRAPSHPRPHSKDIMPRYIAESI